MANLEIVILQDTVKTNWNNYTKAHYVNLRLQKDKTIWLI